MVGLLYACCMHWGIHVVSSTVYYCGCPCTLPLTLKYLSNNIPVTTRPLVDVFLSLYNKVSNSYHSQLLSSFNVIQQWRWIIGSTSCYLSITITACVMYTEIYPRTACNFLYIDKRAPNCILRIMVTVTQYFSIQLIQSSWRYPLSLHQLHNILSNSVVLA